MTNQTMFLTVLLFLIITPATKSQTINWKNFAATLDSAAFEKRVDPKNFSITSLNQTQFEKWKNDDKINGDSLFQLLADWNAYAKPKQTGIICKFYTQLDTNKTIPYFVYVPKNYNPKQKTVLLVYYKGGWLSRQKFPRDYAIEIITDNPTFSYLDKYNVIEIFPALKNDVAIFGKYGYFHLANMVTETKKRFNIDDNKVFLSGFSDGGKTVYNVSSLAQTPFACFYPINGSFPSPPYFTNFLNRPVFSFVATKDEVTDYKSIKTKAEYANKLGAAWTYWELPNKPHFYIPYANAVLPILFMHMALTSRHPLLTKLSYDRGFNDDKNFTGVDWLQIKANINITPSAFHFTDSIQTFSISGEERNYRYGEATGQVKAVCFNNTYNIKTSQIDKVTIYISPLMVDLNLPVKVVINGKELFNKKVEYSKEFMTNKFLSDFDRTQIFVNKIEIDVND